MSMEGCETFRVSNTSTLVTFLLANHTGGIIWHRWLDHWLCIDVFKVGGAPLKWTVQEILDRPICEGRRSELAEDVKMVTIFPCAFIV